jgi:hypothetical protein
MTSIISEHLRDEAVTEIRLLLRDFLKIIKVISMYPPENPLPQKMRRSFTDRLKEIVAHYNGLAIDVRPRKLLWQEQIVFEDKQSEEALAALFFNAGINRLTFERRVPAKELEAFYDIIRSYVNDRSPDRDLISLLWEQQLDGVRYTCVEDSTFDTYNTDMLIEEMRPAKKTFRFIGEDDEAGMSGGGGGFGEGKPQPGDEDDETDGQENVFYREIILEEEAKSAQSSLKNAAPKDEAAVPAEARPGMMRLSPEAAEAARQLGIPAEDPPADMEALTQLIKDSFEMDAAQERDLKRLREESSNFNYQRAAARMMYEIVCMADTRQMFLEAVSICEKVLNDLLELQAFSVAADFVDSLRRRRDEVSSRFPIQAERIQDFLRHAGDRERIKHLTVIINEQEVVDTDAIETYLESLGWESLAPVSEMLAGLVARPAREMVCRYLARHGSKNLDIVANGINDKRWYVVRNTILILGEIGDSRVVRHLARTLHHPDFRVRRETIAALTKIESEEAIDLVCSALNDPDPELRKVCLEHLGEVTGRSAFDAIAEVVHSESFESLPFDEQERFLKVYSRLGGAEVVDILSDIIGRFSVVMTGQAMRYRLAALNALASNTSQEAEMELLKYSRSRRRWLREGAAAALQKRRYVVYNREKVNGQINN